MATLQLFDNVSLVTLGFKWLIKAVIMTTHTNLKEKFLKHAND